jgi:cell division protein YceG involved in septum cleavage
MVRSKKKSSKPVELAVLVYYVAVIKDTYLTALISYRQSVVKYSNNKSKFHIPKKSGVYDILRQLKQFKI